MLTAIRRLIRPTADGPGEVNGYRMHEGFRLPPLHLRKCTVQFKDDAYFLEAACCDARLLVEHAGLTCDSRVLDVGCGTGRLAVGIRGTLGRVRAYHGVDVDARAVGWASEHIQAEHPQFRFDRLDVHNDRYNPAGRLRLDDRFKLPVDSGWADVINLYSVFTHMTEADVRAYLHEFARVLAPGGVVFCTAYVEPGVPDVVENPVECASASPNRGPLHRVRFAEAYFKAMAADAGLTVAQCRHRAEYDHQSGLYLRRAA